MKSKVHLSKTVITITIITSVVLIVALILVVNPFLMEECSPGMKLCFYLGYVAMLLALVVTPLFRAKSLRIEDGYLKVCFSFHRIHIPLADIRTVEDYADYKGFYSLRTFGSGGYWGYIGKFYNRGIGRHTAYAGDLSHAFYVRLVTGKTFLLSCDDKEEFMRALVSKK